LTALVVGAARSGVALAQHLTRHGEAVRVTDRKDAAQLGETMRRRMLAWQERFPAIGDVRGLGAMLAIELVEDRKTKRPAADLATAVVTEAAKRGLLLLKAGIYSNCIRVLSPLTLSDEELDEALSVWEEALELALTRSP